MRRQIPAVHTRDDVKLALRAFAEVKQQLDG